jgi:hypothetical protein
VSEGLKEGPWFRHLVVVNINDVTFKHLTLMLKTPYLEGMSLKGEVS